jgi:hypothetical protein
MPKQKEPESFDVAGTAYRQSEDPISSFAQSFHDHRSSVPFRNFFFKAQGNTVVVYCHENERGLGDPGKKALIVQEVNKALDEFIKGLKKKHREIGAGTLKMSEDKTGRGYEINKVSLNDRWEVVCRRRYEVIFSSTEG